MTIWLPEEDLQEEITKWHITMKSADSHEYTQVGPTGLFGVAPSKGIGSDFCTDSTSQFKGMLCACWIFLDCQQVQWDRLSL